MMTERTAEYCTGPLGSTSSALKRDVDEIVQSGNYYVTPELYREFKHVSNGADHIRLEQHFRNNTQSWDKKFDPQSTARLEGGATQAMGQASNAMQGMKAQLRTDRIQSQVDPEVRATHHYAVQNVRGVQQDMAPYAHEATDRIKQFCDHMGVTDKYTGFRNNLNRGNLHPSRAGFSWLDGTQKNHYNASLNVGWKPGTARAEERPCGYSHLRQTISAPPETRITPEYNYKRDWPPNIVCKGDPHHPVARSVQEQCGINMTFPGYSEYSHRYINPQTIQPPTKSYTINHTPQYEMNGRPVASLMPQRTNTEYKTRYVWPDGSTITKLPWLRK